MLAALALAVTLAAPARACDEHFEPPPIDARHKADIDADVEMGRTYAAEVDKMFKASENAEMTARVQRIGAEIAEIANRTQAEVTWGDPRLSPFEYTFKVIQGPDVNAFSVPGGFIYLFEGLVKYAETDDELAGVLAHEVAHAAFRHVATLRREQSKLSTVTLPLILLSIFTRAPMAQGLAVAGSLVGTAIGSGWSQSAEISADFGGFQYLRVSDYNPVGMLTFMERLAYDERNRPKIEWGIYRTHPPSRERARGLRGYLDGAGIPIQRSLVSTSLRAQIKPGDEGSVDVWFGETRIFGFAGNEALARADSAVVRLNAFFDAQPKLLDIDVRGAALLGFGRRLFEVRAEDVVAGGTWDDALAGARLALSKAVYDLAYRTWDAF